MDLMNHFIIIQLEEEFEGQFTCLGVNTEKHISLSVPTQKEITKIDKNGDILQITIYL